MKIVFLSSETLHNQEQLEELESGLAAMFEGLKKHVALQVNVWQLNNNYFASSFSASKREYPVENHIFHLNNRSIMILFNEICKKIRFR